MCDTRFGTASILIAFIVALQLVYRVPASAGTIVRGPNNAGDIEFKPALDLRRSHRWETVPSSILIDGRRLALASSKIMGVDVARFGDDASIIRFRRGRDARSIPPIKLRGADTMELSARIADESSRHRVEAIFIDGGGVGGAVVDRCRQIGLTVTDVQFRKPKMYEHVFELIYECSVNRVAAEALVDRMLKKLCERINDGAVSR
jgi:hypothetical protein